jgi:hypothetical protein
MDLVQVSSSNLYAIGYDPLSKTLRIKFRESGHVYDYFNVPESKYIDLMNSSSKGSYFFKFIRDIYRTRKVL